MMTITKELINKSYYQTIIDKNKPGQPIQVLGEMYMDEKENEIPNFSSIRFAQGEIYFLNQDYEAAIFKWENVLDESLKPWAQKNIADAHLELNLLELAVDIYKAVVTDSNVLNMEVFLQLFSVYKKLGKLEEAIDTIKGAVNLNPDYSCVTEMARDFFEDIQDWGNAVELTVNEAIRTKLLSWFTILEDYVEQGLTTNIEPSYFNKALMTLFNLDKFRFERLATALWNSYKQSDYYFQWLKEINHLLLNNSLEGSYIWKTFPILFKETYYELISGKFFIKDISELLESHFANWMKISLDSDADAFICSSAIIVWNRMFSSHLDATLVSEAETVLEGSSWDQTGIEDGMRLFESIKKWADEEGLLHELSLFIQPMMEESNLEEESSSKLLYIIKKAFGFLIDKKVEMENAVIANINLNEELLVKINGVHYQLNDLEESKGKAITSSFEKIQNQWIENLIVKIPEVLRSCSDIVKVDSDFGSLHIELNEEMNRRIADYMENTALMNFEKAIQRWIMDCEEEFKSCQAYLDEISESLNTICDEEKIALNCDFKVLDDWKRDMDRFIRGLVHLEKENIMLRNTPTNLLLKSMGKLFGTLSKNKEKLHGIYKNFIENADYSQTVQSIIHPFIQQLDFFERSIERDLSLFFSTPFEILNRTSEEAQRNIEQYKESLQYMQENPEVFRDPITLFELKIRQYELMYGANASTPKYVFTEK